MFNVPTVQTLYCFFFYINCTDVTSIYASRMKTVSEGAMSLFYIFIMGGMLNSSYF